MTVSVVAAPAQLSWSDFRPVGALPDGSGEEAQTSTEMPAMANIKVVASQGKYSLPDLKLMVGLKRSETLVVTSARKTADLLKHEQGHFDITVLTIRALAMELQRLTAPSAALLGQQVEALRQKHQRFADAIEEKYDDETEHSRNKAVQDKWNQAIRSALLTPGIVSLQGMPL
jgi:predicted secreted Zn-dependent protease